MNYLRIALFGIFLLLLACQNDADFKKIKIRQYDNLSAVSIFAESAAKGKITLLIWPRTSSDTLRYHAELTHENIEFRLPLAPGVEYCYQLVSNGESGSGRSSIDCFTMNEAPTDLPQFEVSAEPGFSFSGGILLKQYGSRAAHYILNSDGKITWYHRADSMPEKSFALVNNNELLTMPTTDEILHMSLAGDTLANYHTGTHMTRQVHHDALLSNGRLAAITYEYKKYDFSSFGGAEEDSVKGDGILVLDEKGELIWHWSIFDNNAPGASEKLFKSKVDFGHANAITQAGDGNYLLSFRDFNQIWKIDAESGDLLWKLGNNGDFPLSAEQLFQKQHAIHFDESNNLVVFDNLAENRTISRILFFDLDEQQKVIREFKQLKLPKELFSFKQANAYQISDTTFLVASSMKNTIAIVNLQGNPLWQAKSSETFYRAYYVNQMKF